MRHQRHIAVAAAIATTIFAAGAAQAAKRVDYDVVHSFTWKPKDENTLWRDGWAYGARAQADNSIPEVDKPKPLKGVVEPFINPQTRTIGASVSWASSSGTAAATGSGASGQPYVGTVTAKGFAEVDPPKGERAKAFASSISTLGVRIGRTLGNGEIRWGQAVYVQSVGCTGPCGQGRDPIDFNVTNLLTLEERSGRFLDIDLWIDGGTGVLSLNNGVLGFLSDSDLPLSGRVFVEMASPWTTQQGLFQLSFANGIVTGGSATGQFAGLLPAIGSGIGGAIDLGSLDIDYDFGWGDDEVAMSLDFGNGGLASVAEGIPEPATWLLLIAGFGLTGAAARRRAVTA